MEKEYNLKTKEKAVLQNMEWTRSEYNDLDIYIVVPEIKSQQESKDVLASLLNQGLIEYIKNTDKLVVSEKGVEYIMQNIKVDEDEMKLLENLAEDQMIILQEEHEVIILKPIKRFIVDTLYEMGRKGLVDYDLDRISVYHITDKGILKRNTDEK